MGRDTTFPPFLLSIVIFSLLSSRTLSLHSRSIASPHFLFSSLSLPLLHSPLLHLLLWSWIWRRKEDENGVYVARREERGRGQGGKRGREGGSCRGGLCKSPSTRRSNLKNHTLAILHTRNRITGSVSEGVAAGKSSIHLISSPPFDAAGLTVVGIPPAAGSGDKAGEVLLPPFSALMALRKLPGRGFSFFFIKTNL